MFEFEREGQPTEYFASDNRAPIDVHSILPDANTERFAFTKLSTRDGRDVKLPVAHCKSTDSEQTRRCVSCRGHRKHARVERYPPARIGKGTF